MKLPPHDADIIRSMVDGVSVGLPVCHWCPQPARFRFYAESSGRRAGCLMDFVIHRTAGDNYAQLLMLPGENRQEIEAALEAVEVQSKATDVDVFLYELGHGFYDDELDQMAEKLRARQDQRARALATTLHNGDRVKIVGDIRPTWLQNQVGTIKGKKRDKFSVVLDNPSGRSFEIPATFLRPIPKEAVA
jgi:hypothetical protein